MATPGKGGIAVQASRFAIIAPESDSDEHENVDWVRVPKKHSKKPGKINQNQSNSIGKAATKNAKRRAKKRNKDSSSSDHKSADGDPKYSDWIEKDIALADKEFERNLEIALVNSMTEDRIKPNQDQVLEEINEKTKPSKSKKGGVTLSLQDFHNSDFSANATTRGSNNHSEVHNGKEQTNEHFFEHVEKDIEKELQKSKEIDGKSKLKKTSTSKKSNNNGVEESVRIAHLKDEVEQRDVIVVQLKKENNQLQQELKEVRKRNQVLCKMLSTGEISTKFELLQQLEELTILKNELSQELEKLNSELEQARSKNKILKAELSSKVGTKH